MICCSKGLFAEGREALITVSQGRNALLLALAGLIDRKHESNTVVQHSLELLKLFEILSMVQRGAACGVNLQANHTKNTIRQQAEMTCMITNSAQCTLYLRAEASLDSSFSCVFCSFCRSCGSCTAAATSPGLEPPFWGGGHDPDCLPSPAIAFWSRIRAG